MSHLTKANNSRENSQNIVDILVTPFSAKSLSQRIRTLDLSSELEKKCLQANTSLSLDVLPGQHYYLTKINEKELATEVLLQRHRFTTLVFQNRFFRQAVLSIIQNIYLTKERKIFFSNEGLTTEQERQTALLLFSQSPEDATIPLAKTFQHQILARIWNRIVTKTDKCFQQDSAFLELNEVIERLNTLRNIYMLLTTGLVRKLTSKVSSTYRQSITAEDAHQIGCFGIARAAYRYHPSSGARFSTYASNWILKEIQRQSLGGRLIRIPAHIVEKLSRAARSGNKKQEQKTVAIMTNATAQLDVTYPSGADKQVQSSMPSPDDRLENEERVNLLLGAIDTVLSAKSGDVLKRRYGLGKYQGQEQSVIEIGKKYGVTRGSIYQLEQTALKKLRKHLQVSQQE